MPFRLIASYRKPCDRTVQRVDRVNQEGIQGLKMSFRRLEICEYYNDHRTAVSLMLDDLAPTAITETGRLAPWNDHGYGLKGKDGLFRYFENNFLSTFPEVQGTFFILTDRHYNHQEGKNGYHLLWRGWDEAYRSFLQELNEQFGLAFHGTCHAIRKENGKKVLEFTERNRKDISDLKRSIQAFQDFSGIPLRGAKLPGYGKNQDSEMILKELGFHWWAHSDKMMGHKGANRECYSEDGTILKIPTNLGGNCFLTPLHRTGGLKTRLKRLKDRYTKRWSEGFIQYLYEKGMPITVQEHYSTARIDGFRQTLNIFDDLSSLRHLFFLLRGADVWYTGIDQLGRYIENRDHSRLNFDASDQFSLIYSGNRNNTSLSLKADEIHSLKDQEEVIHRARWKNGHWVFPDLKPGRYTILGS